MECLHETDRMEVLSRLRREGMQNLLLESWLEDFPLDRYSTLYRMGSDNYVLTLPSVATMLSFPDGYELTDEDMMYFFENAAPTIMGPRGIVHQILRMFPERKAEDMSIYGIQLKENHGHDEDVRVLKSDREMRDLLKLYLEVPEFEESFRDYTKRGFLESSMEMLSSGRITTGIYRDGRLLSAASFSRMQLENICTHPDYRNQGLAGRTITELLHLIPTQRDGKRLILFTDNPIAGKLYESLGFSFLGDYTKT